MKLELKHLAGYLTYGLKVINIQNNKEFKLEINFLSYFIKNIEIYKPILRPLSDLTKEIEVNGEKFIPIIELAGIGSYSPKNRWSIDERNLKVKHESGGEFYFTSDKSFVYKESDKWKDFGVACNQFDLFQKLNEWYIDFNGLIEKGLAISIHDVEEAGI
jgi:hypothetical protein